LGRKGIGEWQVRSLVSGGASTGKNDDNVNKLCVLCALCALCGEKSNRIGEEK
jgi:hypothetical protein